MKGSLKIFGLVALIFCLVNLGECSMTFQVEPKTMDCFFIELQAGQKVTIPFFVTRGGLLDIDLRVFGPNGEQIFSGMQYESSQVEFTTRFPGAYQICWSNEMARWTAKVVQFDVLVNGQSVSSKVEKPQAEPVTPGALSPLELSLGRISAGLDQIQKDQKYLRVREQTHRDTAESTNRRILWYSLIESLVLIGLSLGQVYYLRKFFEIKRTV